jgi:hypothetical protein
MTDTAVRDDLRAALAHVHLPDSLDSVVRRGRRVRRVHRTASAAAALAAAAAVTLAVPPLLGPEPVRVAGVQLVSHPGPALPVSLRPVPRGLRLATDLDGGSLKALYLDGSGRSGTARNDVYLEAGDTPAPAGAGDGVRDSEVAGRPARVVVRPDAAVAGLLLSWERTPGTWVTLTGHGRFASESALHALARTVVDVPLSPSVRLAVAPAGWVTANYKEVGAGGAVLRVVDPQTAGTGHSTRAITVQLSTGAYRPIQVDRLEDPGPVSPIEVGGRRGELVRGSRGWYLRLPLSEPSWITVQAPLDLTREQVLEFAGGVRRT